MRVSNGNNGATVFLDACPTEHDGQLPVARRRER